MIVILKPYNILRIGPARMDLQLLYDIPIKIAKGRLMADI
jgi:hypothetical protein